MNSSSFDESLAGQRASSDQSAAPGGQGQPQFQKRSPDPVQPNQVYTAAELFSRMGQATASGSSVTGSTTEVVKLFEEIISKVAYSASAIHPNIIAIEHTELSIPAVILAHEESGAVFFVALLIEGLGAPIPPRIENMYGVRAEIPRDTSDYWESKMINLAKEMILRRYDNRSVQLVESAFIVIHKSTNLKDVTQLTPWYDSAIAAIQNKLRQSKRLASCPYDGAMLRNSGLQLTTKITIAPGATYLNMVNVPILADFTTTVYAKLANQNQKDQSPHGAHDQFALAALTCFVDFLRDMGPVENYNGVVTQTGYVPVFVITQSSALGKTAQSFDCLLTQLLALPTLIPMLSNQANWATLFEPGIGDLGTKTSIGTLALEHNPFPNQPFVPAICNLASAGEFHTAEKPSVRQFIERFVSKMTVVALDIVHGGPLEWVQSILASATPGSPSEKIILDELDKWSNGIFTPIFREIPNHSILVLDRDGVTPLRTVLHTGTFPGNDGLHDIREVNYLTGLAVNTQDLTSFNNFADGFVPLSNTPEHMDKKLKELQRLVPNATITGRCTRIYINNTFISALDKMFAALKLSLIVDGMQDLSSYGAITRGFNAQHMTPISAAQSFNFYNRQNTGGQPYDRFAPGGAYSTYSPRQ